MSVSLLDVFAGHGFADVPASPLQRAICLASEGEPVPVSLLSDDEVTAHFGCPRSWIGLDLPTLVILVCGVRSGKSFVAACGAIRDVLAADVSALKPHEVARHAIVAPTVDNASQTFRILRGIVEGSRVLKLMIVGDPTADTLTLRRPDGRVVEIVVVAAHRGGATLRSRWLAGTTLEETALFGVEQAGAAVNAEELLRAAETRLLPRTQIRIVSSPMGRVGLLYDLYRLHFGKPGRVLVVHAPTLAMVPSFPRATVEALRQRDPDAAAREFDARWIDGETAFLPGAAIDTCTRSAPLDRAPVHAATYVAAIDAATRGNAWTLIIGRSIPTADGNRLEVSLAREWKGSKERPLSPALTFRIIANLARPYHVREVLADRWSFDANVEHARAAGLQLIERGNAERDEGYAVLASAATSGLLDMPPTVAPDLKALRKILTATGFRVDLPRTPDGRHCDFAPSIALAVGAASKGSPGSAMVAALRAMAARR